MIRHNRQSNQNHNRNIQNEYLLLSMLSLIRGTIVHHNLVQPNISEKDAEDTKGIFKLYAYNKLSKP